MAAQNRFATRAAVAPSSGEDGRTDEGDTPRSSGEACVEEEGEEADEVGNVERLDVNPAVVHADISEARREGEGERVV